jgi:hypothetical protein
MARDFQKRMMKFFANVAVALLALSRLPTISSVITTQEVLDRISIHYPKILRVKSISYSGIV